MKRHLFVWGYNSRGHHALALESAARSRQEPENHRWHLQRARAIRELGLLDERPDADYLAFLKQSPGAKGKPLVGLIERFSGPCYIRGCTAHHPPQPVGNHMARGFDVPGHEIRHELDRPVIWRLP